MSVAPRRESDVFVSYANGAGPMPPQQGEVAFLRNLQPPKSCSDGNHTAQTTDTRLHGEGLACCSRLD